MKYIILISVLSFSLPTYATESEKLKIIAELIEIQNVRNNYEKALNAYEKQLSTKYKNISKEKIKLHIDEYKNYQYALHVDSYSALTMNELRAMLQYLKTKEGKRYLESMAKVDAVYFKYHELLYKDMNEKFIKLYNESNKP